MEKQAEDLNNMLNEYETQNQLNPKLWEGDKLHPKLRVAFLKIAKSFYKFLNIPDEAVVDDIILIGSNANYNWTEHSDIDLHVLINYLKIDANYHIVNEYLHAKKSIWNTNFPLTYKGMSIELYAQDSQQKMHSSVGVYSVMRDKWLRKPSAETVSVDDDAIQIKAQPYEYEIDALKETDPHIQQKIQHLKQRLKHLRQTGLEAEGEYSVETMAYKHLRNKGYLERLTQLEKKAALANLAVEHTITEWSIRNTYDVSKDKLTKFVNAMKTEKDETKLAL